MSKNPQTSNPAVHILLENFDSFPVVNDNFYFQIVPFKIISRHLFPPFLKEIYFLLFVSFLGCRCLWHGRDHILYLGCPCLLCLAVSTLASLDQEGSAH